MPEFPVAVASDNSWVADPRHIGGLLSRKGAPFLYFDDVVYS